jgi:AcrR family transcriptional regulator
VIGSGEEVLRPLRADAARNRERILAAATEVFAENGLDATLDDVARRAGVGVGTVYRRFPGKETLVEALFEESVNGLVELAVEAAGMADSWQGLVWFLERACQRQAEDLGLRDVVLHGMCGEARVAEARDRIVPAVTRLVEQAQADGHLRRDVVAADIPILELMVNAVAERTGQLAPDLWRRYLVIVLDGLRAVAASGTDLSTAPDLRIVEEALISRRQRGCVRSDGG